MQVLRMVTSRFLLSKAAYFTRIIPRMDAMDVGSPPAQAGTAQGAPSLESTVQHLLQRVADLEARLASGATSWDGTDWIPDPTKVAPAASSSASSARPTPSSSLASPASLPSPRKAAPSLSLTVLGSGTSTGTPRIPCLLQTPMKCAVCRDAMLPNSKNRRRNPSLLIHYQKYNILIDCGKTFREALVAAAIHNRVAHIDAVVITHDHADACYGLDDLREWTEEHKIPVFVRERDFGAIQRVFPYLVDTKKATGSGYVSQVNIHTFKENEPFDVLGLRFLPFVVEHGPNNTALAFYFAGVLYMSDVSKVPETVRADILKLPPIEVMFVDSMLPDRDHVSHFGLPGALAEIRAIKPKRAYLLGMSHAFEYSRTLLNLFKLRDAEGLHVEPTYDGLVIHVPEAYV